MISHYRLLDQIGSGFSSKVYKALSQIDQQVYAVKVLNHDQMNSAQLQLLQIEIEVLQKIKCPNIIKLVDILQENNQTFLITEYCKYGSLEDQLKKIKQFTEEQTLCLLQEMCNALLSLKQKKIIHNDIKPSNIFISSCFKLADFGFAMKENSNYTFNLGSPLYMSPETLANNVHNYQTDIWSLGITIYQLIKGCPPFQGNNEQELFNSIINQKLTFGSEFSEKLIYILKYMLQVDPKKRITIEYLHQILVEKENVKVQRLKSLHSDQQKQPLKIKESTYNICNFVKQIRDGIQNDQLLQYILTGIIIYFTQQEQTNTFQNIKKITVFVDQKQQPNIFDMVKSELLKFCINQLQLRVQMLIQILYKLNQQTFQQQKSNMVLLINLNSLCNFLRTGEGMPTMISQDITYTEVIQIMNINYM